MSDHCPPCPEVDNSMFTLFNACKILFYTPILFLGGLLTSVAYDYVTFKEEDVIKDNETNKKSD